MHFKRNKDILTQQQSLLRNELHVVRKTGFKLIKNIFYEDKEMNALKWNILYPDFIQSAKQIEKMEWNHDIERLWAAQHEALFWRGFVEQGLQNHDQACALLEEAIEGIEQHSLQKSMPRVYAMAYLCLTRSRAEKQSPKEKLRIYLEIAKNALCDMNNEKNGIQVSPKDMIQVEWNLQKGIVEVGMYQTEPQGKNEKESDGFTNENAEEYLNEAYRIIQNIQDKISKQNQENSSSNRCKNTPFIECWLKRQQLTLYTTYAALNKKRFFQKVTCQTERGQGASNAINTDLFQDFVKAMIFYCYAAVIDGWKNTISTGSMAGLIHYCETNGLWVCNSTISGCDYRYSFESDPIWNENGPLKNVWNTIMKSANSSEARNFPIQEKTISGGDHNYCYHREYCKLLLSIACQFNNAGSEIKVFKYNLGERLMDGLLDQTLMVDRYNMFALSLKASIRKKDKHQRGGEVELYPAMRQAALRKHFKVIGTILDEIKCLNGIEQKKAFLNLKLDFIDLYNAAVDYMDKASAFRDNNEDMNSKEPIFLVGHYTKLSVIPKLIVADSSGRFRLQNVRYLNDPSEGKVMMQYIEKAWTNQEEADKNNTKSNAKDELFRSLIKLYQSEDRKDGNSPRHSLRSSIYLGCFSDRLDQLNMWSRYGDGGKGCCLAIDAAKTFDCSARTALENLSIEEVDHHYHLDQNHYPLYRTIYLPGDAQAAPLSEIAAYNEQRSEAPRKISETACREHYRREELWWSHQKRLTKEFEKFVTEVVKSLENLEKHYGELKGIIAALKSANLSDDSESGQNGSMEKLKREILNTEMVIFDLVRFLVKDDRYRDEREYRVIQYSHEPKVSRSVSDGKGADSEVTKLYVEIEKEISYKYVVLGPLVQNFSAEAAYLANLHRIPNNSEERNDSKEGIPVQQSMIPYCI